MKNKITERIQQKKINVLDHARNRINKLKYRSDQEEISRWKFIEIKKLKIQTFTLDTYKT